MNLNTLLLFITKMTGMPHITVGSCVRIAQDALEQLPEFDILAELIDVQILLPFDVSHTVVESL